MFFLKRIVLHLTLIFPILLLSYVHAAEIVVAQVAAFSGPIGPYGVQTHLGASVLFASVNAKGGVNGSKIRFVARDDKMNPKVTVALFEEVAREEKPVAFLYPIGPESISALLQQSFPEKQGIPILGTIPSAYKPGDPVRPYTFHVGVGDSAEITRIVEHIATLGIQKIGIVHWSAPTGIEAAKLVEREASKRKIDVIVKATVEVGTSRVGPALAAIRNAKPSATIVFLPVDATGAFVKGLREAKDTSSVYALSYTESSLLVQFAGANNVQGVGISQIVPNPFVGASALLKEYQEDMRRFAPKDANFSSLSFEGYIAAKILVEGMRRAGPTINGNTVKTGLEKLQNIDLGGLIMNYDPENHVALKFQNIGAVRANGRLAF
ncbi:ABC transporter substrate-binding protein [Polaromonas hydrogenivorans]|uniref:ABC transporter substrate-binding protein n=1 Tax=Polaromonas hydrogenivorans TaxID=335476 RepID=A0AAU7LZH7_9BURK